MTIYEIRSLVTYSVCPGCMHFDIISQRLVWIRCHRGSFVMDIYCATLRIQCHRGSFVMDIYCATLRYLKCGMTSTATMASNEFQDRFHDSGKASLIGVVYGLPLTLNPKELLCRTSMPLASSTTGA